MTTDDNTPSIDRCAFGTSLYEDAVGLAKKYPGISCCTLQRKLGLGYSSVTDLMTEMVKRGDYVQPIVGDSASLTVIVDDKELPFTVEAHIDHLNTPDTISLAIHLRTSVSRISNKHVNMGNAVGAAFISTFLTSYIGIYRESLELLPTGRKNGYFGEAISLDAKGAEQAAHDAMAMISSSFETKFNICGLQFFITAGETLKGNTISRIANILREYLAFGVPLSFCQQLDNAMGDAIKISILAIGSRPI